MEIGAGEFTALPAHWNSLAISSQAGERVQAMGKGIAQGQLLNRELVDPRNFICNLIWLQPVGWRKIQRAAEKGGKQQQARQTKGPLPAQIGPPLVHHQQQS